MELLKTLVCPRCDSDNTKFCYYNNYNKSQPRHYCRSCKKHWTEGGALRDVPAGSRAVKKRHRSSKTPSKSMFCKTVPTSRRSGCKTQAIVRSDENLDLKADTQLVVHQKDESFGGISSGCGKKETLFECYDVLTDDDIVPLELFSFELPEVSDLMVTGQNEAEDRQQWQWRVPNSTSDNVSMDLGWEDHHQNDLFFASDILSMDVPELMQP